MQIWLDSYSPGLTQSRHAHDVATCSIVLAGSLRERVGRVEEVARPLSIVFKPAGTEHADTFGDTGARLVRVYNAERNQLRVELSGQGSVVNVEMQDGRAQRLTISGQTFTRRS